jgi:hypothetical protein
VENAGGADRRIVGWARTDRWYVQATEVAVGRDGAFEYTTRFSRPGHRVTFRGAELA